MTRRILLAIALFYPAAWCGGSLAGVLPALARAITGSPIRRWELSALGVQAANSGPSAASLRLLILTAAALLLVAAARFTRGWIRLACALLTTGLAMNVLFAEAIRATRTGWDARAAFLAVFAVLTLLALRILAAAFPADRYLTRAGALAAAVALPWATLPLLAWIGLRFRVPRGDLLWLLFPVAAMLVCVALAAVRTPGSPLHLDTGWRPVAAGLLVTAALVTGIPPAGSALAEMQAEAQQAAARRELAALPATAPDAPYPKRFFQKGANFTAEFPDIYGSAGARETLRLLPSLGIDAIALVPYGFTKLGSTDIRTASARSWENDEGVEQLARLAHSLGLKVMLKPQLWVGGGWPADLDVPPDQRAAWFAAYARFLEHYAKLAARIHADLFCVGNEFSKMTRHPAEWRKLIALARTHYPGPLTYGAVQGEEFENLQFWDALDYIGISNYYPLPDDLSTAAVAAKIEAVHRRFGKPVLFVEAGFGTYANSHREPWSDSGDRLAPQQQARAYEAVFRAFWDKPWFAGVYWWKLGSNRQGGPEDGSHAPWGKPALDVIKAWYARDRAILRAE